MYGAFQHSGGRQNETVGSVALGARPKRVSARYNENSNMSFWWISCAESANIASRGRRASVPRRLDVRFDTHTARDTRELLQVSRDVCERFEIRAFGGGTHHSPAPDAGFVPFLW